MKGIGFFVLSVTLMVVSCGQAQPSKNVQLDTVTTAAPAPALTGPELEHYTALTSHFFEPMLGGRFNGSILVAKNGVIIYEHYKGFRNPTKKIDSLTGHTAFHLASIS
ncbi:MAG TPA: hypothetical protein VI233_13535, partial [Puia sp.]